MTPFNFIVRCDRCGAKNRIPRQRVNDRPVCGKCRAPLPTSALYPEHPLDVDDRSFGDEVLNFPGAVVAFFWATWCVYCRQIMPVIDELAKEFSGRIKFVKVLLDHSPNTASRYDILSVPTLLLFKGGRQANRLAGSLPKQQLEYHFRALL